MHVDPHAIAENRDLVSKQVVHVRQRSRAEARGFQSAQQPAGVFLRRIDEDVEIERSAGDAVQDGGDTPDDDVPNAVGVEGREYVLKTIEQAVPRRARAGSEAPAP